MKCVNFLCIFSCVLPLIATTSHAALIDTQRLAASAKDFLVKEIQQSLAKPEDTVIDVTVRPIDSRLRLAACDNNLTFERKNTPIQTKTSIKAICRGDKPWSTFISARVSLKQDIVTVKHELPRHHVLDASDLTTIVKDISGLRRGYSTDIQSLVGMQLKRNARSGSVIYSHQLQLPDIIKKGDLVTVITRRGGLVVSTSGVAMNDGSKGEKIRVENQRSERILQATIVGPGSVEVIL